MKTSPVAFDDLGASVLAVPPLAWHRDFTPNRAANAALIRHLEAGGVSTLLYGGNANFYNIGLGDFRAVLEMLAESAAPDTWVIPSVGPDYGKMMDQVAVVKDMGFPTAMVLPLNFPATPAGVETGVRRFVEAFGERVILYVKFEGYLEPEGVKRLVDDGLVCAIKYAIVRKDQKVDDYLTRLVGLIDRRYVISGIGERPAVVHLRDFGLNGFTSGSVCIAPNRSTEILRALKAGDDATAEAIRAGFLPFEGRRDAISPIRVLHDGVTLAGIADMGPILPLMAGLDAVESEGVAAAARQLLAFDREAESARVPA